ncbi:DUF2145 domain-containing protein [Sulfitobacter sp.]|uniref:DUF2145 domain-containing protein n=1 Tax=Sulfitobacter sp. TaxID=1903071 RepID=UPI0035674DF9
MRRLIAAAALAICALHPVQADAGSSQAGKPLLPAEQVAAFSDKVQIDLAARGASVAIVARKGRHASELPQGVTYTHVAFWVFSEIKRADGSRYNGYRVYNLYQDAKTPTRSALVQDGPADFFAGAHALEAGIIIPDPRLQRKLLRVIGSPTYKKLHNSTYSVLANPQTRQFQNCTEHTLDVLMAALYDTSDPAQIKSNITAHFTPQVIKIGSLKRAFAPVASKALTTQDHGTEIRTATFGSILRFMKQNKLVAAAYTLSPSRAAGL